jgi:hypothetical protein
MCSIRRANVAHRLDLSLDPDLLRELNARYLHDINATRSSNGHNAGADGNGNGNGLPAFLLPPFLRAEHFHQHTHTHEHNLNIFSPPSSSSFNGHVNNSPVSSLSMVFVIRGGLSRVRLDR